jgi:voltage-gated potassium channel
LTASLGYLLEHDAQPDKFENIPTAIYWAVITLASVGYGDIAPVTPVGRGMTIILALMGIGIFAIPAALLSSAFTDELVKERNQLKAELFTMLKDGQLSDEEIVFIRTEAKRLHLSIEEINALIQLVLKEFEEEKNHPLPIHRIAEKPELSVEHFKATLVQMRQLGLLTDNSKFDQLAIQEGRLSADQLEIWQKIQSMKG